MHLLLSWNFSISWQEWPDWHRWYILYETLLHLESQYSPMDRLQDILTTPQHQQQHTRHALHELAQNVEESPRHRSVAPRPETLTPRPGYMERTRASSWALGREACNANLLASLHQRHLHHLQNENIVPNALTLNNMRVMVDRQVVRCNTKNFFFYQFSFNFKAPLMGTLKL